MNHIVSTKIFLWGILLQAVAILGLMFDTSDLQFAYVGYYIGGTVLSAITLIADLKDGKNK